MAYILPLGQAHGDNAWRSGPKAARLSALNSEGFKVPAGFAVTTDALSYFLAANTVAEEVGGILVRIDTLGAAELGEWPARLRQLIVEGTLPEDLADELHRAFDELNDGAVVVRSSSTLEDRADLSFAGQHDSFLNIQSFDACVSALKEVWASLYSDRALAYLRALDRSAQPLHMGVVVQQLVPANAAGVAFTVHPLSGDYEEIYISVALGLGEGTVSGEVAPDEVVVGRSTKEVLSYTIGAKAERVVANADGGTSRVEVEEGERGARALSGEQVLAVAELALKVEEAVGGDPHDVEWAFVGDELYLLQARPLVQKALAEGVEEALDVGRGGVVAHETDAPYFALHGAKAGADFDAEVAEQPAAHAGFVRAVRYADGVELPKLMPLLRGDREAQLGQAGLERIVRLLVPRPARLETFL